MSVYVSSVRKLQDIESNLGRLGEGDVLQIFGFENKKELNAFHANNPIVTQQDRERKYIRRRNFSIFKEYLSYEIRRVR